MKCFSYTRSQVPFLEPTEESPGLVSPCVIPAPGKQRGGEPGTLWPASLQSVSSRPGTDHLSEHKLDSILRNNSGGWPLVFICAQVYPLIHSCVCGYTHIHILAGNENIFCTFHMLCDMTIKHNDSCAFSWAFSLLFVFLIKLLWVFVLSYFILILETQIIKKKMKTFKSFFW